MDIVKLKDLTVDGKGTYGVAAPAVEYQENLPTYLRITDILDDGTLNLSELKSVKVPDSERYMLRPNDIVFARTGGSTGRNYFYDGTVARQVPPITTPMPGSCVWALSSYSRNNISNGFGRLILAVLVEILMRKHLEIWKSRCQDVNSKII